MTQAFLTIATPIFLSLLFSGAQAVPAIDVRNGRTASRSGTGGFRMVSSGWGANSLTASVSINNNGTEIIGNFGSAMYSVNVTINGEEWPVQIDTGSSDLWVYPGDRKFLVNSITNLTVTEEYDKGKVEGPVAFADVEVGKYHVKDQALIYARTAADFAFLQSDVAGLRGILGLGFDGYLASDISTIIKQVDKNPNSTRGQPLMANIFAQNPNTPNFFDISLDRLYDLDEESYGTFTIGEHIDGFEHIEWQPKLWRLPVERWTIALDAMTVNGKPFQFGKSSVSGVLPGQAAALLDTSLTFPPLPPAAVDFIYQSIPGSVKLQDQHPQYAVPCNSATNVSFIFAGMEYSVHPLDLTYTIPVTVPINGIEQNVTVCFNAYQYSFLGSDQGFDMILGDSFLRNVYASFDFGLSDSSGNTSYIQLLSTTDKADAWAEFFPARAKALKELPQAIDLNMLVELLNTGNSSSGNKNLSVSGSVSADSSDSKAADLLQKYGPIVIGLLASNFVIGVFLFILGIALFARSAIRNGAKSRSISPSYAPVRFKEADSGHADPYLD